MNVLPISTSATKGSGAGAPDPLHWQECGTSNFVLLGDD